MDNPHKFQNDPLRKTLAGENTFDVFQLLGRGHQLVMNNLGAMLQGSALLAVLLVLFAGILSQIFPLEQFESIPPTTRAIIEVGIILVFAPLQAGLILMASHAAAGESIRFTDIFRYAPQTMILAINQLVISMGVQLGLTLLILPGLYLLIATTFALPLVAQQRLSVWQSILLSCQVVNKYLLRFISLFGIFTVLFILGILTSGFALIWVVPVYFSVLGILYCDLFGVSPTNGDINPSPNETTFNA